jgi:hypothetical protein
VSRLQTSQLERKVGIERWGGEEHGVVPPSRAVSQDAKTRQGAQRADVFADENV